MLYDDDYLNYIGHAGPVLDNCTGSSSPSCKKKKVKPRRKKGFVDARSRALADCCDILTDCSLTAEDRRYVAKALGVLLGGDDD